MVSTGYPSDSDPRDEHPVCHECREDLSQDFWGDWFCAEWDAQNSQKNEESAANAGGYCCAKHHSFGAGLHLRQRMNALIDTLMARLHELTQENKRLTNENQKQKETIDRLGSQVAEGRSTGVEITDHGAAGEDAGICSANCVVGLLRRQDGATTVAGDGHVAPSASIDVQA